MDYTLPPLAVPAGAGEDGHFSLGTGSPRPPGGGPNLERPRVRGTWSIPRPRYGSGLSWSWFATAVDPPDVARRMGHIESGPVWPLSCSLCKARVSWPDAVFLGRFSWRAPSAPETCSSSALPRADLPAWLPPSLPVQGVASSVRPSGCPFVEGCWWSFSVAAFQPV